MGLKEIKAAALAVHDAQVALQKAARDDGKQAIGGMFQEILKRHPDVGRVSWVQYTPWFNDGDSCTFSVHSFIVPAGEPETSRADWDFEGYGSEEGDRISREAYEELTAAWDSIDNEELLKVIFGDHVKVTVTAEEGCEISEYAHD